MAKVKEGKGDDGFNAATDVYEDLVKAGVIDPAKVVRNALQNAASIASLLLTTEAIVAEIPEDKKEAPAMPAAAAWAACTKDVSLCGSPGSAGQLIWPGGIRSGRAFVFVGPTARRAALPARPASSPLPTGSSLPAHLSASRSPASLLVRSDPGLPRGG